MENHRCNLLEMSPLRFLLCAVLGWGALGGVLGSCSGVHAMCVFIDLGQYTLPVIILAYIIGKFATRKRIGVAEAEIADTPVKLRKTLLNVMRFLVLYVVGFTGLLYASKFFPVILDYFLFYAAGMPVIGLALLPDDGRPVEENTCIYGIGPGRTDALQHIRRYYGFHEDLR